MHGGAVIPLSADELSTHGLVNTDHRTLCRCSDCGELLSRENGLQTLRHMCLVNHGLSTTLSPRFECKLLHPLAKLPQRKRITDAGYDIFSVISAELNPHHVTPINTGIAVAAPQNYYYEIKGRSGLALKGVIPFNATIDATYTGELIVMLENNSDHRYYVKEGDRIAQMVIHAITHADMVTVSEFSDSYTIRGTAGFGASGR